MTNYEITRNLMRDEFTKYDQDEMIRKYDLEHDGDYLYIDFILHRYRIGRADGVVEWSDDGFEHAVEADFNESMTLYDLLCYGKEDRSLSGNFCMVNMLKGVVQSSGLGNSLYQKAADEFSGRTSELRKALAQMGELMNIKGDVAANIYPFSFFPMIVQFWDADEEFPANLKFMFDENVLQYMHYETLYYLMGHLIRRIKELMASQ